MAYENTPLLSVHGNVTRDPFVRETPKGEVLNFGLAVNTSYEDGSTPTYYDVAVWNEGLQESCKAEVYKGAKVAITGSISQKVVDGKTYNNLSAHRVGLIEFLARSKSTFKPSNTGSESSW